MYYYRLGGRNMPKTVYKRAWAVFAAVVLLAFLMLSPLCEFCGEHDHSCCANHCLICFVSNTLAELRISLRGVLCAIAIILFIYVCEAMRTCELFAAFSTPVALKTKITS